jgi:septal ring factor EnvC (AmiA/AmiB activator)
VNELGALNTKRQECLDAKGKLLATCRHPDVQAAAADLERRRRDLEAKRAEVMRALEAVETDVVSAKWEAEKPRPVILNHPQPADRERAAGVLRRLEDRKAELESELSALVEQASKLDAEQRELETTMLNP